MLPVGVLIPTRNSMQLLPRHVEAMRPWLDLVEEIVVVDSDPRDGTLEFLRRKLPANKTRFFTHPTGLYQSWNFGIQRINTRYAYISTIGDEISRDGLLHLAGVAEKFSCDIVISPPDFVSERGRAGRGHDWPVHRLVADLNLQRGTCLEGIIPFLVALAFLPFALLGSSASNLYRTALLQENPFPTDFGWNGDGAWGLANVLKIRLGVAPHRMSFFRKHRKLYPPAEYTAEDSDRRMLAVALASLEQALSANPELRSQAEGLGLDDLITAKEVSLQWRAELKRLRTRPCPWILNPLAWRARFRRTAAQHRCEKLLKAVLASSSAMEPKTALAIAVP